MNFKFNEDEQKVIDLIHEFGVRQTHGTYAGGKGYHALY